MSFDLIENVQRLVRVNRTYNLYDKNTAFQHLIEEVGEVGTCLNVETTKRKVLKEPLKNECVDVINCALELFFMSGGTIEELYEISKEKQKKWENNLNEMIPF